MRGRKFNIDWGEALIPAIVLSFGIAFFLQTVDAPLDALFWPLITAAAVLVFWLFTVKAFAIRHRAEKTDQSPPPAKLFSPPDRTTGRVGLILASSIGYLLLIPYLGFTLTNFFFMLVVFRSLGSRRWLQNLAVAFGIALFLHVALVVLMKQELPQLVIGGLAI